MKEKFYKDLQKLYEIVENEQKELERFYDIFDTKKSIIDTKLIDLEIVIDEFLTLLNLPIDNQSRLAAVYRIVNLREDSLTIVMKDSGFDEEDIIKAKEKAYLWVADFYIKRFEKIIEKIEKENLLTKFYRAIIYHTHQVGKEMSSWQSSWMAQIVNGVNRELYRLFNGDEEKIFELLNEKNLLDMGHEGEIGDRSYSVLRINNGKFERLSYAEAFEDEVKNVVKRIDEFIYELKKLKDEIFGLEDEWVDYLIKMKEAFLEKDPDKLIPKWAEVDRAWMKITSPIQIGHPLEYYEDHYRKAVALEWDIRIINPKFKTNKRKNYIEAAFKKLYLDTDKQNESIFKNSLENLNRVQLYIGRPLFWYGAEFNGLFSAQVVPNDEKVSKECGKKIFAYADMIYESQKSKPPMKITKEVFGKELTKKFRQILKNEDIWHKVYDITTIGHEYGHILWMDENSEALMNRSGQFKNVEEFKATTGGLISFFMFEEEDLWEYVLQDNIQRAVSLISWRETPEVLPYYIEALLHLQALFDTKIFEFDKKLKVNITKSKYEDLKEWYFSVYKELVRDFYLEKRDPKDFLDRFVIKKGNFYTSKDKKVAMFVEYYWNLYKKIGRVIEE
ncbi:invasion protein CiaB [Nitrosophilus kaiyonis]|uniref:invasion protein CiaB n=1 Tax=Nitrosophilus kaiyonis TaxID=2930200 RepID=UPI002490F0E6|nr:invasion protein CiaB [Nitrosophilus kaiyonis]